MVIQHFFGGSALANVQGDGRVRLPRFVRDVAALRSDSRTLVIGVHESDRCLVGYDPAYRQALFADTERSRLADSNDHRRARRTFGLTEQTEVDSAGRAALPPMLCGLARIETLALFVGTGGAFEIWNPHVAAGSGDPSLAEIARWRLGHDRTHSRKEEE